MWDLSSLTSDQTCIPCIGRRILNHWTNREALWWNFLNHLYYNNFFWIPLKNSWVLHGIKRKRSWNLPNYPVWSLIATLLVTKFLMQYFIFFWYFSWNKGRMSQVLCIVFQSLTVNIMWLWHSQTLGDQKFGSRIERLSAICIFASSKGGEVYHWNLQFQKILKSI